MYIYNVTIKIENAIQSKWLQWMELIHIPEVMATELFTHFKFCQLIEPANEPHDNSFTYVVQYFANTKEHYDTYINDFAPALRQKSFEAFGNSFIGFRSLLQTIS